MSIVTIATQDWSDVDGGLDVDLGLISESETYEEKKRKLLEKIAARLPKFQIGAVSKPGPRKIVKKKTVQKTQIKQPNTGMKAPGSVTTDLVVVKDSRRSQIDIHEEMFKRFLSPPVPRIIRCDTMAYFPTAFANCLNSGNNTGLSDLVRMHLDHQCDIRFAFGNGNLNCYSFLKFFELMNEIHPDRIMHVSTTDVVDNHVRAAVFMKYTDCKTLYQAVARTVTDPTLFSVVPATRAQYLSARVNLDLRPDKEREELNRLVDSDFDLVVYGCMHVTLTLDATTNRATGLLLTGGMTTAHLAGITSAEDVCS